MSTRKAKLRIACSDCGQRPNVDNHLTHELTCPRGLSIDATTEDDRRWFEEHPTAKARQRPLAWSEREDMRAFMALPDHMQPVGLVTVKQLAPGVRMRSFDAVFAIPAGVLP